MYEVYIEAVGLSEQEIEDLRSLYTTFEGTIPLNRSAGISIDILSKPIEEAKVLYRIEIIKKTRMFSDKVEIKEITFETDSANGSIKPKVVLTSV